MDLVEDSLLFSSGMLSHSGFDMARLADIGLLAILQNVQHRPVIEIRLVTIVIVFKVSFNDLKHTAIYLRSCTLYDYIIASAMCTAIR